MSDNRYSLNEVLKARKAASQDKQVQSGEVKLDDLSRVRCSPPDGRCSSGSFATAWLCSAR